MYWSAACGQPEIVRERRGLVVKIDFLEMIARAKEFIGLALPPRDMIKAFWVKLGVRLRVRYITEWSEFESYIRSDSVQLYRYG